MKTLAFLLLLVVAAFAAMAAEEKSLPGQAGNDIIELTGSLILDPAEIRREVGGDLGPGYILVRVKATPKTGDPMRVGPADFTLISRKNGERAESLAPAMITASSVLVIARDTRGRDWAQQSNEPGFTGVTGVKRAESPIKDDGTLLAALKGKELADAATKGSAEGLLYFSMDGTKLKAKDFSLLYKGPGGRLVMDFK